MSQTLGAGLIQFYFHRVVPWLGHLVAGNRAAYTYLPQSVDYFLQADRLAGLFRDIGLVEVSYRKLGFGAVAIHQGTKPAA
jgi:demethylmenaquinone methyltransferase/2-methoxy-6-polyprenyl-1,4-benzoquinol methylase